MILNGTQEEKGREKKACPELLIQIFIPYFFLKQETVDGLVEIYELHELLVKSDGI